VFGFITALLNIIVSITPQAIADRRKARERACLLIRGSGRARYVPDRRVCQCHSRAITDKSQIRSPGRMQVTVPTDSAFQAGHASCVPERGGSRRHQAVAR
jgi:hypothetical protein